MKPRLILLVLALAAVFGGIRAAVAIGDARRAASAATQRVRQESQIEYTARTLEPLRAPAEHLVDGALSPRAVVFRGHLYVAGAGGLAECASDVDGGCSELRRFRPGVDLPPAPITALATGALADSTSPELFLATNGQGLIRFDGARFRQMLPRNPAPRKLTALLPTSDGRLLLGTESDGVLAFDGAHLEKFHPSLTKLQVTALAGDATDLWIGTLADGLLHFRAGMLDRFHAPDALPDPQVLSLYVDGPTAYAGTPMGVAVFEDGHFQRVVARGVFSNTLLMRGADLLIGTFDQGVLTVGPNAHITGSLINSPVRRLILVDNSVGALTDAGLVWMGRTAAAPVRPRLANANIAAVAIDEARVYVGYFDHGLDIIDAGGAVTHREDDTLFCVNSISIDPATHQAAVSTANGLAFFDASGRLHQTLHKDQGLLADHVTQAIFHGGTTIAATPAGLTFFDRAGPRGISGFQGLVNNHVYTVAADGDRVLAGTLGGLSIIQNGAVAASYTTANSRLRHNWITALAHVGPDWFVGSYGGSVMRFTPGQVFEKFDDMPPKLVVNENAMLVTGARVYAGTLDSGLLVYERASGRWRLTQTALPSLNVTALAASGGLLYIGTDNGLVRIPEEALI